MRTLNTVLCILLCVGYTGFSQEIHIKSNQDLKSIPYATISYMRNDSIVGGTYSDEKGIAKLDFKKSINKIVVSHLSFYSKDVNVNNIGSEIFLEEKQNELAEITI